MSADHKLFTKMLFVDAIVGVGFPTLQVGITAERDGLATVDGTAVTFAWRRDALEALDLSTLQDLYTALKLYEVTHAG